ncbi:hypothetical protein GQ457_11G019300 [Hibiscus cannabinus]
MNNSCGYGSYTSFCFIFFFFFFSLSLKFKAKITTLSPQIPSSSSSSQHHQIKSNHVNLLPLSSRSHQLHVYVLASPFPQTLNYDFSSSSSSSFSPPILLA